MEKLKLPVSRKTLPEPKYLSMDDYLKFVNLNLRHTIKRGSLRQWKKRLAVNIPFFIQ